MYITKLRVSNTSFITTIPKEYAEYFHMEKGDKIIWKINPEDDTLILKIDKSDKLKKQKI